MPSIRLLLTTLLLVAICGTGCDTYEHVPAPSHRQPILRDSIVVLTSRNCQYCDKQKATLESMRSELRGVKVEILPYERESTRDDYPGVRSFPTAYINNKPYVGYQTREAILSALQ